MGCRRQDFVTPEMTSMTSMQGGWLSIFNMSVTVDALYIYDDQK